MEREFLRLRCERASSAGARYFCREKLNLFEDVTRGVRTDVVECYPALLSPCFTFVGSFTHLLPVQYLTPCMRLSRYL